MTLSNVKGYISNCEQFYIQHFVKVVSDHSVFVFCVMQSASCFLYLSFLVSDCFLEVFAVWLLDLMESDL